MKQFFVVVACIATFTPAAVFAASVSLISQSLPISFDTPVGITLTAENPSRPLNAIEGSVTFDETKLEFLEAKTRSSVIGFWIEYPYLCEANRICFSGISPGGFSDISNELLTLQFLPIETGDTVISVDSLRLLQHDGKGTDESVELTSKKFFIEQTKQGGQAVVEDTEPPEAFSPAVVKDEDLYDGQNVLLFSTNDKQSELKAYQVKETPYAWLAPFYPWKEAESPYVLMDQDLRSYIYVKAIDEYGNERVSLVPPSFPRSPVFLSVILISLLVALIGCVLLARKRVYRNRVN